MMKYLIIQLCDTSVSFCHYSNGKTPKIIPVEKLRQGLLWAVKRGLYVQVLYPDYDLPTEYLEILGQYDHAKISKSVDEKADVIVIDGWDDFQQVDRNILQPVILRSSIKDFIDKHDILISKLTLLSRINIVFTDIDEFKDSYIKDYSETLDKVSAALGELLVARKEIQVNFLTDRLMLNEMNNCNAGVESITLAPDGNFYICPAFYHDGYTPVGNLSEELNIANSQLYKIEKSPICRNCDAYHCKRCVWLNKKSTLEVNTPGHEQCVVAHIERNASRKLLNQLIEKGKISTDCKISEIDYLDPFDKIVKL